MRWYEISLETLPEEADEAVCFFNACGFFALSIDNPADFNDMKNNFRWDYIDAVLLGRDTQKAFVKAYTEDESVALEIMEEAKEKGFLGKITSLESSDWENEWKKYYKPFSICENVVIVPFGETYTPKEKESVINLDCGLAFGSGTHESTAFCAKLIQKHMRPQSRVLDLGTGSGILALISAKLGAAKVRAIDIEEAAIKAATKNATLNNLQNIVFVTRGDLLNNVTGAFDVIVANIVADVIISLFSHISRYLKKDGCFITGGIIDERAEEVLACAERLGYTCIDTIEDNGWASFVFKQP